MAKDKSCTFKWAKVTKWQDKSVRLFKWQGKSVRLNGKTKVYV